MAILDNTLTSSIDRSVFVSASVRNIVTKDDYAETGKQVLTLTGTAGGSLQQFHWNPWWDGGLDHFSPDEASFDYKIKIDGDEFAFESPGLLWWGLNSNWSDHVNGLGAIPIEAITSWSSLEWEDVSELAGTSRMAVNNVFVEGKLYRAKLKILNEKIKDIVFTASDYSPLEKCLTDVYYSLQDSNGVPLYRKAQPNSIVDSSGTTWSTTPDVEFLLGKSSTTNLAIVNPGSGWTCNYLIATRVANYGGEYGEGLLTPATSGYAPIYMWVNNSYTIEQACASMDTQDVALPTKKWYTGNFILRENETNFADDFTAWLQSKTLGSTTTIELTPPAGYKEAGIANNFEWDCQLVYGTSDKLSNYPKSGCIRIENDYGGIDAFPAFAKDGMEFPDRVLRRW